MTLYRLLHGSVWYAESPAPKDTVRAGGFANSLRWLPHIPQKWRRVIRAMLRDDPALRCQDANQVITGLAGLPIQPNWSCDVTASEITWERETRDRRIKVAWRRHSARRHEWNAWSEPMGTGRRRTLGGSEGIFGRKKVVHDLETFLAK